MVTWIPRIVQKLRRSKRAGVASVLVLLALSVLGNAVTFYFFDKPLKPDLTFGDALWYSVISITTIGYGDFSATSAGARIGTVVFIVLLGLSAFSGFLGLLVDAMMNLNFREIHGLTNAYCKDHILIVNFPDQVRVEKIIQELREDPEYEKVDVVLVTDQIDTIPFDVSNTFFVKGSPMQIEVLERANLKDAKLAIVLSTSADDPGSDGKVASVITLIEHLHPEVRTVAECLDERHEVLFRSARCDRIVFSNQVVNNLLVQETQDRGVSSLVTQLTDNGAGYTLYSSVVSENGGTSYSELASRFKDASWKLISVERAGEHHLDWGDLKAEKDDTVVYIGTSRKKWEDLLKA